MMWEVPVMARIDGHDVLFISFVDRREGGAKCSVRGWVGSFDGGTFVPELPGQGQLIDVGPDFYAATVATGSEPPLLVAWLSSWQTARKIDWGGFAGGPISLPRTLAIEATPTGNRIISRPAGSVLDRFIVAVPATPRAGLGIAQLPARLSATIRTAKGASIANISLDFETGTVRAERAGETHLEWQGAGEFTPTADGSQLLLFVDGPVMELFLPNLGLALSCALPGDGENFEFAIDADGERIVPDWFVLPDAN